MVLGASTCMSMIRVQCLLRHVQTRLAAPRQPQELRDRATLPLGGRQERAAHAARLAEDQILELLVRTSRQPVLQGGSNESWVTAPRLVQLVALDPAALQLRLPPHGRTRFAGGRYMGSAEMETGASITTTLRMRMPSLSPCLSPRRQVPMTVRTQGRVG